MAKVKIEYTDEQKAAVLAEVKNVGVHKAAKAAGIPWQTVTKWATEAGVKKMEDKITAEKVEAKKKTRAAGRKAKAAVEEAAEKVSDSAAKATEDVRETVAAAKETAADEATGKKMGRQRKAKATGRKVKEAIVEPVEKAAGDLKDAAEKARLVSEIEKGKKQAKKERKKSEIKEKVEEKKETVKAPVNRRRASKLNLTFQSPMGGAITPEEIAAKVPKEATDVYVRIDENKIYWVSEKETGAVDIWE